MGAGATLTDTIQWAGNTPLVLDLDFDWTTLMAGYQGQHPEYGDFANEAAAQATVAFSLQIEGAGLGTINRGFYFQRAQ